MNKFDLKYSYFKNQFEYLLKPEWHALMNKIFFLKSWECKCENQSKEECHSSILVLSCITI